jgi:hypothetical protein
MKWNLRFMVIKSLFLIILLIPSLSWAAAPAITGVTGTITDGGSVVIAGSGFGSTHAGILDAKGIQFLKSNIEAGTNGENVSLPTGWATDTTDASFEAPHYSTSKVRGGSVTKAMQARIPSGAPGQYGSGFWYDYGAGGISQVYASWYVYPNLVSMNDSADQGQWKILRLTPGDRGLHTDTRHNVYFAVQSVNEYPAAPLLATGTEYLYNYCCDADPTTPSYGCQTDGSTAAPPYACYNNVNPGWNPTGNINDAGFGWDTRPWIGANNRWLRFELFAKWGTADTLDGQITLVISDQSVTPKYYVNWDATMTHGGNAEVWRYLNWQNYWGNGSNEAYFYFTDVYVQFGTQARIEICKEATWATRTHCEIQYPIAWAETGDSITVTVNKGSFGAEGAYVYVVDSSGAVSDGYGVTFDGGPGGIKSGVSLRGANFR